MSARRPEIAALFLEVPSSRNKETHVGFESLPKVVRWKRGQPRSRQTFNEFFVEIANLSWNLWVGWHEEDEEDEQTGGKMLQRARTGGSRYAQLDERVAIQLLTAATDTDLLPSLPNAYDGVGLFSAASRFGVAGGNVVPGSGIGSPNAIRSDFIEAIAVMHQMQDTEDEPFWTPEDLVYSNMLILFNPKDKLENVMDAFKADMLPSNPLGSGPLTNLLAKGPPALYPTQRISGDDLLVVNIGSDLRPLVKQNRRGLRMLDQRPENSDVARDTKEIGVGWDDRRGFGIWEPRCAVQIDN